MSKPKADDVVKDKSVLYRLTLVAAVVQPLMTLPQAIQLYSSHDAHGLSLLTWFGYTSVGLVFLAYSIKYRLRPIIIQQTLWFILQSSVVVGIVVWQ
ncbi:MAG: hypothetical protein H6797_00750 [Candidatus Nomurabacteria bacterium]|nr:MAG: hypothetical protein H6797_00750 [Candidatus Nomurabacteria bacterium]